MAKRSWRRRKNQQKLKSSSIEAQAPKLTGKQSQPNKSVVSSKHKVVPDTIMHTRIADMSDFEFKQWYEKLDSWIQEQRERIAAETADLNRRKQIMDSVSSK